MLIEKTALYACALRICNFDISMHLNNRYCKRWTSINHRMLTK